MKKIAVLVRKAGLSAAHLLGFLLGHLLYVFQRNRYRVAHLNINLAFPGESARAVHQLTRATIYETGKLLAETVLFWLSPKHIADEFITSVHGGELVEQARHAGKGIVLICPHLGNWELLNFYASRLQHFVSYKPSSSRLLDAWLRSRRVRFGAIAAPLSTQGLKALRKALPEGGVALILPDQAPLAGQGRVQAPFFGIPAWTGTLVPRLLADNVVAIFAFARRLPDGQGFAIELVAPPDQAIYSKDLEQAAAALNKGIEKCVLMCPEQYLWEYKRYKNTAYPKLYNRSRPLY